jgi:hypothetical protein
MDVIVLATRKGGSGKSTLAIGLALAAQRAGHLVRLIETDPRRTLSHWQSRRGVAEPLVETIYHAEDIEPRLQSLRRAALTLAVIDTAGGQSDATTAAIRAGDLCLIPTRPSVPDIEASASTLSTVRAFRKPFAFVLNQTPPAASVSTTPRTHLARERRPTSPMSWRNHSSPCATIIRMRYAPGSPSANTRLPANQPTRFRGSGNGSRPNSVAALRMRGRPAKQRDFRFYCARSNRTPHPRWKDILRRPGMRAMSPGTPACSRPTSGISGTRRLNGHSA